MRPFRFSQPAALSALALVLTVGLPQSALAWMFSGDVLIHKVATARRMMDLNKNLTKERKGKLSSVEVTGHLMLFGSEAESAAKALSAAVDEETKGLALSAQAKLDIPGKCRLDVSLPDKKERLSALNKGEASILPGGMQSAVLSMFADVVCPLLDGRGGYEGPMGLVKAADVTRTAVTLGRAERDQIAYVIGASNAQDQEKKSSLWVAKDIFQPVRFIDRSGKAAREVRFIDYSNPALGRWFPKRIEFLVGGELKGVLLMDAAKPNVKFPAGTF